MGAAGGGEAARPGAAAGPGGVRMKSGGMKRARLQSPPLPTS